MIDRLSAEFKIIIVAPQSTHIVTYFVPFCINCTDSPGMDVCRSPTFFLPTLNDHWKITTSRCVILNIKYMNYKIILELRGVYMNPD